MPTPTSTLKKAGVILLVLAAVLAYLFICLCVWADSWATRYMETDAIAAEVQEILSGLDAVDTALAGGTYVVNEGGYKAEIQVEITPYTQQTAIKAQVDDRLDVPSGKNIYKSVYFDLKDINAEVGYLYTEQMHPLKAIGHGWVSYDSNLYAKEYGNKAAEGKPNYNNRISFVMQKDGTYYRVYAYSNKKDFIRLLEETVQVINENTAAK